MIDAIGRVGIDKEFVIAGDSHIFSMGASQGYEGPTSLRPIENLPQGYFLMENWGRGRTGSYWDALAKHVEGRVAVLVVMGNQHFSNFLLARLPLFDFFDTFNPEDAIEPGAVVVPRRMVRALPAFDNSWLRNLIRILLTHNCLHVFVLGTPPVRGDYTNHTEELRSNVSWSKIAQDLGLNIATLSLTPEPIMKRLWGVLQESLATAAHEEGARFLPIPKTAFDSDGYLSTEYRGPLSDFTHANRAYGLLMLNEIARTVAEVTSGYAPIDTGTALSLNCKITPGGH